MTSGEVATLVSVIGSALTFLGVSGIDSSVVGGAVNGVISLITIVAAVYAHFSHKNAVAALAAGSR